MYSPKIKEVHIPTLYQLAKAEKRAMTNVVNDALESYFKKKGVSYERLDVAQRRTGSNSSGT